MSEIGTAVGHHPWWMIAGVIAPLTVFLWVTVGSVLLERRHGAHIFAGRE
jgi:hypothetical protein